MARLNTAHNNEHNRDAAWLCQESNWGPRLPSTRTLGPHILIGQQLIQKLMIDRTAQAVDVHLYSYARVQQKQRLAAGTVHQTSNFQTTAETADSSGASTTADVSTALLI